MYVCVCVACEEWVPWRLSVRDRDSANERAPSFVPGAAPSTPGGAAISGSSSTIAARIAASSSVAWVASAPALSASLSASSGFAEVATAAASALASSIAFATCHQGKRMDDTPV